jgi:hypothetical protein
MMRLRRPAIRCGSCCWGWLADNPNPGWWRDHGIDGRGIGFIQPKDKPAAGLDAKVERTAVEAARRKFSPEFLNWLDTVVVFHPLKCDELDEVLDIELEQVQKRIYPIVDTDLAETSPRCNENLYASTMWELIQLRIPENRNSLLAIASSQCRAGPEEAPVLPRRMVSEPGGRV